ncbi:MAG: DNA repair protein RecN [Candidatus Heteroscillospira sp.]|jgi:DNA repair protein RecN (Recombination protein N)
MLRELYIENVAVIRRADIGFGEGLNVLTGETGAGKSIIIDSLGAILGGRVSRELVRRGCDKAVVTAVFSGSAEADAWLGENDMDAEDELIVQRRIGADGKSACRINGTPIPAAQLRELGAMLIDIHGQNDGRRLLDEATHRAFLDAYGNYPEVRSEFDAAYACWKSTAGEIDALEMDERDKERLTENLRYTIDELTRAQLREGEYDELSERAELLRNSEKLTEAVDAAYEALYGADGSASELCGDARGWMTRAAAYAPELQKALESVQSASSLIEDAAETLRDFRSALDFSPEEYDRMEARLQTLRRLFKKYGRDEEQLIEYLDECEKKLDGLEYAGDRLEKLKKQLRADAAKALEAGKKLTAARKKAAGELQKRIEKELRELSMPSARFLVETSPVSNDRGFEKYGCDEVRFLMAANAGTEPGRIARIASGGELSRIMLAMKNVFAETDNVETMVFDEIDTGVSGIAAQRVAEKLSRLARGRQVLCVTHLPQIAAMADTHLHILKTESGGETSTDVSLLDKTGRMEEIARLYGGEIVTETTLKSAAEQLAAAEEYKRSAR